MNSSAEIRKQILPPRLRAHRPEVDFFYHLGGNPLVNAAWQGTACFVARHLDFAGWETARVQNPCVSCLGKCYAAPGAVAGDKSRPPVPIHSRERIVRRRVAEGGAPTLTAYRERGGYEALETALRRSREEIVRRVMDTTDYKVTAMKVEKIISGEIPPRPGAARA